MPGQLVQLHRAFLDVPENDDGLDPSNVALLAAGLRNPIHWPDLLDRDCVVVLGEAGTGKTTEFRQQVDRLHGCGRAAFFISIEDLAQYGVEKSLRAANRERFSSWKAGVETAHFFLDSLDEARLRGHRFSAALRNLEAELDDSICRARMVISSRVSDWRSGADLQALATYLPDAEESRTEGTSESRVRVVALAPLAEEQVRMLAATFGVKDVEAFTAAISKSSAQVFAERPRDVEWLASYWRTHRRLGSLRELVDHNIDQKLRERNPDRRPVLSPVEARRGAAALAGLATVTKRGAFVLPDAAMDPDRAAGTIDPLDVLTDWSNPQVEDLLTRPLFDESTYGRVRIHHRTAQEFLTAEWLKSLLDAGMSRERIHDIVFRDGTEGVVVASEAAAAAAWLSLEDVELRDRIIEVAPHVLIAEGDPNGLPVDVRSELLRGYARQFEGRSRLFHSFDHVGLGRFAAAELAETINELLDTHGEADELRETLLGIIAEGAISDCADSAFQVAMDPSGSVRLRASAIQAVGAAGTDAQKRQVALTLSETPDIDQDIGGALVGALYPEPLGVDGLLDLLGNVQPKPHNTLTSLAYLMGHQVPDGTDADQRPRLARGLLDLLADGASTEGVPSGRRAWLLEALANVVSVIVDAAPDGQPPVPVVDEAIRLLTRCNRAGFRISYGVEDIQRTVARHPELRRHLFWGRVAAMRARLGRAPTRYYDIWDGYRLWNLVEDDAGWLAADARTKPDLLERLIALDTLLMVPCSAERVDERRALLAEVGESDEALRRKLDRGERRTPSPYPKQAYYERLHKAHEIRQQRQHEQNLKWLTENIETVRAGTNLHVLTFLWEHSTRGHDAWTVDSVDALIEDFGRGIAEAAREGWKRFWRNHKPPLPHEEKSRNKTSGSVIVGLNGIAVDIHDGLNVSTLSADEADKAARYATRDLNRFPAWLDEIAIAHPAVVAKVFGEAIAGDYQVAEDDEPVHDVLAKLAWARPVIRFVSAPVLLALLEAGDPPKSEALLQAVEALLPTPEVDLGVLARLAPQRCADSTDDLERFAIWWTAWFNIEPIAALSAIEDQLDASPDRAGDLVIAVCDRLWQWSERHTAMRLVVPADPAQLKRLVALVFAHVRPEEDSRHLGTFSPGPRDHAQMLRGRLVTWLTAIEGNGTVVALRQLAADDRFNEYRDWFLHLAEQRNRDNAGLVEPTASMELLELYRRYGLAAMEHVAQLETTQVKMTERVDFAIITALPEELEAVLSALGNHSKLDKDGRDTGTYYVARVQTDRADGAVYQVVVSCLAQMGPLAAAAKATAIVSRWHPRNVLLVGIACGVVGEANYGDVLVARQVADYTLGKQHDTGERDIRWEAHQAGANLVDSAVHVSGDWHAKMKFSRPAEGVPSVVFGVVASGGDVISNAAIVARYRSDWSKLVGIEMEGGGAAAALHQLVDRPEFLLIKAVSDLGPDKHDKDVAVWRPYACHTAAAFAVALLRSGPTPLAGS